MDTGLFYALRTSVIKVSLRGEIHGDARALGGLNDLCISHAATGLHHGADSSINQNLQTIRKWEEGI